MFEKTYYFIDGSSLIADIKYLQRTNEEIRNKKLSISKFVKYFTGPQFRSLTSGWKRFTLYFVRNEDRINDLIILPNFTTPGENEDIHVKYCGKRIRSNKSAYRWLEKNTPPKSILEILNKSEKAVDTQICCDALSLSCYDRLDRLFLYTNDFDYFPLCEELKRNGSNISLFRLQKRNINKDLIEACDTFSVVEPGRLKTLFV
ncbi:MAG: NYN domain-containing protein [Candidatus Omnitrophica bacterium]|nr:NYN domain-containing protein [Candidatus Omnitrophota bacterium]